ncbi:MAG: hypothetical protein HDR22_04550 [Lachnospiraceae bacterium]|nr:hypothetical protein [Lachnospiraceae bacterium]
MKQEKADEAKKKRNQNRLLFGGIFLCAMLAVAVFSACNAVKKYGGDRKEEVEEESVSSGVEAADESVNRWEETAGSPVSSQGEKAAKGNKNSYERYLETIDSDKITKEHMTEGICFSREMSEEEQARWRDLQDRYEEGGLTPKEEIDIVDKMEDTGREVEHPVFEIWNHEYFLPKRTLTDEDLLRMIDFEYKLSAAVSQRSEELSKAAEDSSDKVEEDEAMEIAGSAVEKMFDLDASSMDKEVDYNGAGSYYVYLSEKSESTVFYTVMIAMGMGQIEWIYVHDNDYDYQTRNAVEINQEFEQLYSANYKKAKAILEDILGSDMEMISSGYQYMADMGGKEIPEGGARIIYYYFQMENGIVYDMQYFIDNSSFKRLSSGEKGCSCYWTKEELEKEGAKKDGAKFFVPLTGMEKETWGDNLQWVMVPME